MLLKRLDIWLSKVTKCHNDIKFSWLSLHIKFTSVFSKNTLTRWKKCETSLMEMFLDYLIAGIEFRKFPQSYLISIQTREIFRILILTFTCGY